jgi:hypothetical protein
VKEAAEGEVSGRHVYPPDSINSFGEVRSDCTKTSNGGAVRVAEGVVVARPVQAKARTDRHYTTPSRGTPAPASSYGIEHDEHRWGALLKIADVKRGNR